MTEPGQPEPTSAKYIEFVLRAKLPGRKTDSWVVWPKGVRDVDKALGFVAWHAPWRCYTFSPIVVNAVVYDRLCLRDIADFCEAKTTEYRGVGGRKQGQ